MQFWAVVVDSFRESRDRRIFWILLGLTALIALIMLSVGFDGGRVSFLFGMFESEADPVTVGAAFSNKQIIAYVVHLLLEVMFGWIGVILMIVATAGFFPGFLERGIIDVVLAKPLSRPRLFLYKYLAGMVFVLVQAAAFVGVTFLVMGFHWGVWAPGYLMAAPMLVLLFSYVYCVSVWIGVKTRSTLAAILLSLGAWVLFAMFHQAPQIFDQFPELQKYKTVHRTVRMAAWIPPKTGDITYLVANWAGAGTGSEMIAGFVPEETPMSPEEREQWARTQRIEEQEMRKNPLLSIGSSLLFEAVIVLAAMWTFTRKDF